MSKPESAWMPPSETSETSPLTVREEKTEEEEEEEREEQPRVRLSSSTGRKKKKRKRKENSLEERKEKKEEMEEERRDERGKIAGFLDTREEGDARETKSRANLLTPITGG